MTSRSTSKPLQSHFKISLIQPPHPQIQIPRKRQPHKVRYVKHRRPPINPPKCQNHKQHQHPQNHQPHKREQIPLKVKEKCWPQKIHRQLIPIQHHRPLRLLLISSRRKHKILRDSHQCIKYCPNNGKHPSWWRQRRLLKAFERLHPAACNQRRNHPHEKRH